MHVYIHIPFCDSKCGYCAFFSKINQNNLIEPYFQALLQDLKHQLRIYRIQKISSIFIGGGTPNFVDSRFYKNIFEILLPLCESSCEISFESNPNLLKKQWLIDIKSLGLNCLSLGAQSFYDDKLELLERKQSKSDILHAFEIARKYLDNVNIDLIYDCALDSKKRLTKELESILHLDIEHISAYSLSIDSGSRFAKLQSHKTQSKQSFGEFVKEFLTSHGFLQYEVSNFTRNKKCEHNLGYWRSEEYIGVGASAVGRIGACRYTAVANIESYIENPLQKHYEFLQKQDLEFEEIFLGLRSEVGVRKEILDNKKLRIALDEKICYEKQKRIYTTNFFLADSLALYLSS